MMEKRGWDFTLLISHFSKVSFFDIDTLIVKKLVSKGNISKINPINNDERNHYGIND